MLPNLWTWHTCLPVLPLYEYASTLAYQAVLLGRHLRFVRTRAISVPLNNYVCE